MKWGVWALILVVCLTSTAYASDCNGVSDCMALVGVWAAIIGGLIIAGIVLWWAWPAIAGLLAASGEGVALAGAETATEAEIGGELAIMEAEGAEGAAGAEGTVGETASGEGTAGEPTPEPTPAPEGDFASDESLTDHFEKHGPEFGYQTEEEYLQGARALTKGGQGIETSIRSNGDKLFYNPATNEFAVLRPNGIIRTYFKPTGSFGYWLGQIGAP